MEEEHGGLFGMGDLNQTMVHFQPVLIAIIKIKQMIVVCPLTCDHTACKQDRNCQLWQKSPSTNWSQKS